MMNSVWYKIHINIINKEELFILLFALTNNRLWVLFKKPVHHAASEYDMLQVFMCLYWHTRGQPWVMQQNRHITENGNIVMVKCQCSRCRIHSNKTADAGFQGPWHHHQCTALLWNLQRPLCCYKRKCLSMLVRVVYCTAVPIPMWPILSRTYYTVCSWRCWSMLHTAQTCYCVI